MLDSDFVPETGIFEIQNSLAVDLWVAYFRDWFDECFYMKTKCDENDLTNYVM